MLISTPRQVAKIYTSSGFLTNYTRNHFSCVLVAVTASLIEELFGQVLAFVRDVGGVSAKRRAEKLFASL